VADSRNDRIQKFTSNGNFLTKWGSFGTGDGQLHFPRGLAVDNSGNVYVADTQNFRIQKFTSNGGFLTKWGSQGTGNGQFNFPYGLAVDNSGNVYVADPGNWRIQKFQLDTGTYKKAEITYSLTSKRPSNMNPAMRPRMFPNSSNTKNIERLNESAEQKNSIKVLKKQKK